MPKLPKGMKGFYAYVPEDKYQELWENISVTYADDSGRITHGAFHAAINEAVEMWINVSEGTATYSATQPVGTSVKESQTPDFSAVSVRKAKRK